MKDYNDKIDSDIRDFMRQLPEEKVHPSVKVELMERIERHHKRWQPESLFAKILIRVSSGALVASLAVMFYFTPILIKFAQAKQMTESVEVSSTQSTNSTSHPVSRPYGAVSPGLMTVANR